MENLILPSKDKLVLVLETSCDSPCPHCFIEPGDENFETAKQVTKEAFNLGYSVYFYATQITPDCFEIYKSIGQDESSSSICIRGDVGIGQLEWLINKKGRIGFSLHGAEKETHEMLSGRDSFDKTLEAIAHVSQHNQEAKTNIWSVIHNKNKDEVRGICEIARDLGVDELNFAKLSYLGRARRLDSSWFLNMAGVRGVIETIDNIYESGEFPNPNITLAPNWGMTDKQTKKFKTGNKLPYYPTDRYCPAGVQHFTVDSRTLNIYPCHHLSADPNFIIGYWTKKGVVITDDSFMKATKNLDEPCGDCNVLDSCGGGCRSEAVAEHLRLTGEYKFNAGLIYCRRQTGGK